MLIRVLLLGALAFVGYRFFLRRQKLPIHIVILFGILAVGAFFFVFPDLTNQIAHFVGVGRGVDLINYVVDIAVFFVLVLYYTKFVELESQVTHLVREIAILRVERNAHHPQAEERKE
jgi:hypothetical protein